MSDDLVQALQFQARACEVMGSPLNGGLLRRAAADVAAGGPTARLLDRWTSADAHQLAADAVALRLVGSFHEIVLSGDVPELAAAYARQVVELDPDALWTVILGLMDREAARIRAFMDHEPQTNEVRRSICLVGGFLTIAQETGLPLRCLEIGASAGLNSSWDRYFYRLGEASWGDPKSPMRLDADWTGDAPPVGANVEVVERAACDRRPTDLTNLAQRRRLLAYIWPDQLERLARARAAIGVTLANGLTVEAADAIDWTIRVAAPKAGAATIVFHSVFWQYLPSERRHALREACDAHGAQATEGSPFAWLRMEPPGEDLHGMDLMLTLWPGGETRTLAHVHPHGATVTWLG